MTECPIWAFPGAHPFLRALHGAVCHVLECPGDAATQRDMVAWVGEAMVPSRGYGHQIGQFRVLGMPVYAVFVEIALVDFAYEVAQGVAWELPGREACMGVGGVSFKNYKVL